MKRLSIIAAMLLLSHCAPAQIFAGIGYGKGISFFAGGNAAKLQAQYAFTFPVLSAAKPQSHNITVGYAIGSNVVCTPLAGISLYSYKDFTAYNTGGKFVSVQGYRATYGAEISKTWYMGRLFVYGSNTGYGIGIKCLFKEDETNY